MKEIKLCIFICFCLFLNIKVYAIDNVELKDGAKINNNAVVTSYNSSDIYVEGKKIDIENFETVVNGKNIYRKYVSLDDIVKAIPTISYNETDNSNIISVNRKYDKQINGFDVYYDTEHDISKKTFTSVLFVGKDDKILFGDSTRGEVLTADADTLKINNKIYVSLRFLTESLGAEVVHKSYSTLETMDLEEGAKEERVTIDFYSNEKYGKIIEMEWKNDSGEVVALDNIQIASNGSCFKPNFSYQYREEGKSDLKSINDTYVKIYSDENNFKWNINEKKLCINNDGNKSISDSTVIVKYRGVPIIIDINNLGISQYCKAENLTLEENCNIMECDTNPKCGIIQGDYYCCTGQTSNETTSNKEENSINGSSSSITKKVMLIAGHAPNGNDVGAQGEAQKTREITQIVENYLKQYVEVNIFNRDVLGEDINAQNFSIAANQYFANCNDSNSYKYANMVCNTLGGKGAQAKDYDFSPYDYVLELHFNDAGGAGTFITSASKCSQSQNSSGCYQTNENAEKINKIASSIMNYMKNTGISYNASSVNGIRDDWYFVERYVRVSTNHKVPASLMEVCALDHDMAIYESKKEIIGQAIAHGIVEGLGLSWDN